MECKTDAYIYATNLALARMAKTKGVQDAIADSAKVAVQLVARMWCNILVSYNTFLYWFLYLYTKFASAKELMK